MLRIANTKPTNGNTNTRKIHDTCDDEKKKTILYLLLNNNL